MDGLAADVSILFIKTAFLELLSTATRTRVVSARGPGYGGLDATGFQRIINLFVRPVKIFFYLSVPVKYIEQSFLICFPCWRSDLSFNFTKFSADTFIDIAQIKKCPDFR